MDGFSGHSHLIVRWDSRWYCYLRLECYAKEIVIFVYIATPICSDLDQDLEVTAFDWRGRFV